MDLNNVEFTWIKNKPESWKTQRVKNHFILTKNRTETPQGYPILSFVIPLPFENLPKLFNLGNSQ